MAIRLCQAHIDRQVGPALECNMMLECQPAAPVGLGQPVDAELSTEAAAVEDNRVVRESREIDLARDHIGFDAQATCAHAIEPESRSRRDCRSSPKSRQARCPG